MNYILNDVGEPVEETDLMVWAKWVSSAEGKRACHVANDLIVDVRVSTVFLGLDYSSGVGPKQLYETMVFGGWHDQYQERYATRSDAEAGHREIVKMVKNTLGV